MWRWAALQNPPLPRSLCNTTQNNALCSICRRTCHDGLFGHLFNGRYNSLVVDGAGPGCLRTQATNSLKWIAVQLQMETAASLPNLRSAVRGIGDSSVNMWNCPLYTTILENLRHSPFSADNAAEQIKGQTRYNRAGIINPEDASTDGIRDEETALGVEHDIVRQRIRRQGSKHGGGAVGLDSPDAMLTRIRRLRRHGGVECVARADSQPGD
jgi:hypothetical protein